MECMAGGKLKAAGCWVGALRSGGAQKDDLRQPPDGGQRGRLPQGRPEALLVRALRMC